MIILIAGMDQSSSKMEKLLAAQGHQAARVSNGLAALEWLRDQACDAVIAARKMPIMDGLELCAMTRADNRLKDLPFLIHLNRAPADTDKTIAKNLSAHMIQSISENHEKILKMIESPPLFSIENDVVPGGESHRELLTHWMLKKIEEKSRQLHKTNIQKRFFKSAVEQASEMVAVTGSDGNIEYVNPAFESITGYTKKELIGNNPRILKSGRQDKQFYQELWQTITSGEPWHGFFINRRKDGNLYREEAVIKPIKDDDGTIQYFVTVKRDITQENRLQRQLIQSQKMEAIGTLAGGIAHDFNNILSAILGFAELALFELTEGSRSFDDVSEIVKAGNRAKDLVRQILTFSRKTEQEFKPINIVPLISEALKFLRATLPSTIEIQKQIDADRVDVLCNSTMVQQILMNLCTNAAHAMKDTGGILTVRLLEVEVQEGGINNLPDLPSGPYMHLTISDTGPGIESGILGRIFDPYFTTKEKGEGTGLGLSVVHGIAQSLKGAVEVESDPGKGTEFNVYLPRVIGKADMAANLPQALSTGNERILLADDEDALATMGRLMLDRLGYKVTVKTDSYEALETFRAQPFEFDLIISDKTMPGLTGFDLAQEIKKIRPNVPFIICTGYSDEIEADRAARLEINRLIVKPLSMDDLAKTVRSVLDDTAKKPPQR
jgi:PAS domain S-box-containing protein